METFWFVALTFMLIMYVILDGFDLGAGIVHLLAAGTDTERRTILNAIGPVWDGNEVWLLASGGVLYFSFPPVYASSFSGFYLPLMIVLWLLMLRAIGIEFRHQIQHPMWHGAWDVIFAFASVLLAVFFGAALGNVVRGVPLDESGYFFEPLWTTFTVTPQAGILDWYTVLMGLVALFTLAAHGANYIVWKTTGELQIRARRLAINATYAVMVYSFLALLSTAIIRPGIWQNYLSQPWGFVFPLLGLAGLIGMLLFSLRNRDLAAFLASSAFIAGMGAATAFSLFPDILPSSIDTRHSLTVFNSAAGDYGLRVGLVWWIVGMMLTVGYFTYLYHSFRGKVVLSPDGEGY